MYPGRSLTYYLGHGGVPQANSGITRRLYQIKTIYFANFVSISATDIGSAVVVIGKAGERLAKGILRDCMVRFEESASFDVLLS